MAIAAIDATVGGPAANSYVTEAEANAYLEIRPGAQKWDGLNEDQRRGLLLFARILIDRETFWGRKRAPAQALQFPRSGDEDTVGPFVFQEVKDAQVEQALDLACGGYLRRLRQDEIQESGIRQVTTGQSQVRSTVFRPTLAVYKLGPASRNLILPFIDHSAVIGRA